MSENAKRILGNFGFLIPALALSFLAGYPLYQDPWYFLAIGVGILLGAGVAWLGAAKRLALWWQVAIAYGVYVIFGLVVAAPQVLWAPSTFPDNLLGVLLGPVAGPNQILSLELPLGTYHQVLAPFFFLAVFVSWGVFSFANRTRKIWPYAAPLALIPLVVSVALGSASLSSAYALPGDFGDVIPPFLWHAIGATTLVLVLFFWLFWRSRLEAGTVLREKSGRWLAVRTLRGTLGAAMIVAALVGSYFGSGFLLDGKKRDTLREDVEPALVEAMEASPLSTYRQFFSNELFNLDLFAAEEALAGERLRLATLTTYDGAVFGVVQPGQGDLIGVFAPVASSITPPQFEAGPGSTKVHIFNYEGPWVPLVGSLGSLQFQGSDKVALQDGFYYSRETGTAVEVGANLQDGTTYSAKSYQVVAPPGVAATFSPAQQGGGLVTELPDPIAKWIADQEQPRTGAGLVELISRMRQRGYLSHSLAATPPKGDWSWVRSMPNYQFEPSRGGHSLDRITRIFERFNERADGVGKDAAPELLVSAPGDDEQFAVAAAIVADSFGFNTRVVVGARLEAVGQDPDLPHCSTSCTGGDMAVWIEVQDADTGVWGIIDTTPQHKIPMSPRVQQTSDPKHATEVAPQHLDVMPPPLARPSGGDVQESGEEDVATAVKELSPTVRIAGVAGFSLLALLILPLTVVLMKAVRTGRRKRAPNSNDQIRGAWQDYLDRANDYRYKTSPANTRLETANELSLNDSSAPQLASMADFVSYGFPSSAQYDAGPAWALSGAAKKNLGQGTSFWRRLRARLSLRSLTGRSSTSTNVPTL